MNSIPTLRDVAKRAGVSYVTVSNAINRPEILSPGKRDKILKVIQEMRYVPNPTARGLRLNKTYAIAFLTQAGIRFPYVNELVEALQAELAPLGYHLHLELLYFVEPSINVKTILQCRCDGVISHGLIDGAYDTLLAVKKRGVPVVVDGNSLSELDCVSCDRLEVARLAIFHLLDQGHRRIAIVNSPYEEGQVMCLGGKMAFEKRGLRMDEDLAFQWAVDDEPFPLWNRMKNLSPRPTAIFCENEAVAMSLMRHIRLSSLRIPQDIAIVAQGNTRDIRYAEVPLTTVDCDMKPRSRMIVKCLMDQMQDSAKAPQQIMLQPYLIPRQSSQIL
jgi:LacI family transcriptional regulator